MNLFLVRDGRLVTPPLSETILDGITRRSVIELARDRGVAVEERPIEVNELAADLKRNVVSEMMAVGTAAVVTPITHLGLGG